MEEFPDDYGYWRDVIAKNTTIFSSEGSFKHQLAENRDAWRKAGVIIEQGSGDERFKVLLSISRYLHHELMRTRNRRAS